MFFYAIYVCASSNDTYVIIKYGFKSYENQTPIYHSHFHKVNQTIH